MKEETSKKDNATRASIKLAYAITCVLSKDWEDAVEWMNGASELIYEEQMLSFEDEKQKKKREDEEEMRHGLLCEERMRKLAERRKEEDGRKR